MVLTNAEVRPRPRPVSAITPDTPLHEVAINTWMCVERKVAPRQRRWRIGRAFCQRASPSRFSLEDPADTADSYACWTHENADEAAVGWTERVRQDRPFLKEASNSLARPGAKRSSQAIERRESTHSFHSGINAKGEQGFEGNPPVHVPPKKASCTRVPIVEPAASAAA